MEARRPGLVRVVIVEDDNALRELLQTYLTGDSRIEIVATASSLAEARSVIAEQRPDVVLLDYALGDGTGLELLADDPAGGAAYLALTGNFDPQVGRELLAAGARGFMHKSRVRSDEIVRAIHVVATAGIWLPDGFPEDEDELADGLEPGGTGD